MTSTIASIVLTVLTTAAWISYCVFLPKMMDAFALKYGIPVILSFTTMFNTMYLFSYVLDLLCPDTDPDGCAGEANAFLVFFCVFFIIAVNLLYCFYKIIDREV